MVEGCEKDFSLKNTDNGNENNEDDDFVSQFNGLSFINEDLNRDEELHGYNTVNAEGSLLSPTQVHKFNNDIPDLQSLYPAELVSIINRNTYLSVTEGKFN
jgi:hypothetical protein